jgi:hypothetical protein
LRSSVKLIQVLKGPLFTARILREYQLLRRCPPEDGHRHLVAHLKTLRFIRFPNSIFLPLPQGSAVSAKVLSI